MGGPTADGAGEWKSTFPGKYLEGGKEAGGQLVDQRLLPRIDEGEVRSLMAGDTCQARRAARTRGAAPAPAAPATRPPVRRLRHTSPFSCALRRATTPCTTPCHRR